MSDIMVTLTGGCDCCSYPEERELTIKDHHNGVLITLDGKEIVLSED